MKVAILSVDYLPLMYTDVRRAICLVYLGKAEIVKATDRVLRSVSSEMKVPKVIRLLKKTFKKFKAKVTFTRRNLFTRDNHTCQYCGSTQSLTLDHVIPRSRGGSHTWENAVTACSPCNASKADKTPDEWGVPLKKEPRKPSILMQIDWDELFDIQ